MIKFKDLKVGMEVITNFKNPTYYEVIFVGAQIVVLKNTQNNSGYPWTESIWPEDCFSEYKPPVEKKIWVNYIKSPAGNPYPVYFSSKENAIENMNWIQSEELSSHGYKYLKTHYTIWHDDDLYSGVWLNLKES
jgi:hypothetical protein